MSGVLCMIIPHSVESDQSKKRATHPGFPNPELFSRALRWAGHSASRSKLRMVGDLVVLRQVGVLAQMEVRAVSLIRSDLRPTGAVYTPLAQVSLEGAP